MYKHILGGFISCVLLAACSSEVSDSKISVDSKPEVSKKTFKLDARQNKIREDLITALEKYTTADVQSGYKGYYAQALSMAGREDIPFFDKVLIDPRNTCLPMDDLSNVDPLKTILRSVENHTLVIINEDHKMPRDRVFVLELLKALKEQGFTHFAAETFQPLINVGGSDFSVVSDGYYSNEPIFGRLISYAKAEGFELVDYEIKMEQMAPKDATVSERIDTRENAQRDNLISAVLGATPNTKMIIHVGHSHVAEIPIVRRNEDVGTKWMAARLKEKTGIDPLTLSQTACRSKNGESVVTSKIQDKDNNPVRSLTDYAIGHTPLTFSKNRPDWRRDIGDIDVAMPPSFTNFSEPAMIEARIETHPDSAVPIDRVLIREGENKIPLLLPAGRYRIEAFNKDGRLGNAEFISVSNP